MKKVYIGNLPFTATEADIDELFAGLGTIININLIHDRETGRSKGFGFIDFEDDASADKAIEMNGCQMDGRSLKINNAQERRGGSERRAGRDRRS